VNADATCFRSPNSAAAACQDVVLELTDSYGDGWNGNVLTLGSSTYTIESGSDATYEVCLVPATYPVTVCGGLFAYEVSWSIELKSTGATLLSGEANNDCASLGTFTIESDGGGGYSNNDVCSIEILIDAALSPTAFDTEEGYDFLSVPISDCFTCPAVRPKTAGCDSDLLRVHNIPLSLIPLTSPLFSFTRATSA